MRPDAAISIESGFHQMKSQGKGFRENMTGSGTDDVRDALDRRVEFKIEACGA
jgi:hypothetical protein